MQKNKAPDSINATSTPNPASELAKKRWSKVSSKDRIKEMKRIRAFGKQKLDKISKK